MASLFQQYSKLAARPTPLTSVPDALRTSRSLSLAWPAYDIFHFSGRGRVFGPCASMVEDNDDM